MRSCVITSVETEDRRYALHDGAGSDAVHNAAVYALAVCSLSTDTGPAGSGYTLTMGAGNELVCGAIKFLGEQLVGREIEELMQNFAAAWRDLSEHPAYRWLGPHKGVVHLALAAVTNACFDLWAKARGLPLWKLLMDLSPDELLALLDFRYVEDFITPAEAKALLEAAAATREERTPILTRGYTGYDTSVGWFNYSDRRLVENAQAALDKGFTAMKLKVGSRDHERDLRRAMLVREAVGDEVTLMLDVNQQWNLSEALELIPRLKAINPYWVEEPTDPDDLLAHRTLARAISPVRIALGEHVPNKVMFKNFLQSEAMSINQVDAVRVGGIAEFILISLMSKKAGIPVIPHVGDMGHIHQHLVFFNHVSLDHPALFLEYIPHLEEYFTTRAMLKDGRYLPPQEPGSSSDLVEL